MKPIAITLIIILGAFLLPVSAQVTIDNCQSKARENYPLIRRYDLISHSKEYTLSNAGKAYLPQLSLTAKASYQSDVTRLPIEVPGIDVPSLSKDQYNAYLELNQAIWDGGVVRSQRKIANVNAEVEEQQLNVDIYALEDRVNQLFFGILLLNEQLVQNKILQDELQRNYRTVSSYMENGTANQADLDAVKVEELKAKQNRVQIESTRKSYVEMLSYMIGETIDLQSVFVKPEANLLVSNEINRPELLLFESQNKLFESQKRMVKTAYMPKVNLFLQGGVGRPGLNMLDPDFDTYYMGGVRLSWNFGALYTQKNDIRKLEVSQENVLTQKEIFLYNTHLQITQENQEIRQLKDMMQYDDAIIALRENVKKSAEAKVANGTMTVIDLMHEISQENLARQDKIAHEIQLLMAVYNLKNTTNN